MCSHKIVLLGGGNTGKTAWMKYVLTRTFETRYIPTIGVEVRTIGDLAIWDCAGDKRYGGLRGGYYHGAEAAVVFYTCGDQTSIQRATEYIQEFKSMCPHGKVLLVCSKTDLGTPDEREISAATAFMLSTKEKKGCAELLAAIKKLVT